MNLHSRSSFSRVFAFPSIVSLDNHQGVFMRRVKEENKREMDDEKVEKAQIGL